MKVVLFCGGMGTRIRDYSDRIPKSLVEVGAKPILWHLMKYYAHFGHKEFILCLGHGAKAIKDFFLQYDSSVFADFVMSDGGATIQPLDRDIKDWRITFVDTGLHSNVGERLRSVRDFLEGDELFLANYSDALCDLDLGKHIEAFRKRNKVASFLSVAVPHTFHIVHFDAEQHATKLEAVTSSQLRINGGFFVFRQEVFEYLQPGEELVVEPFQRLMEKRQLLAVPHNGFWRSMDTFKDKMELDALLERRRGPWQVWHQR